MLPWLCSLAYDRVPPLLQVLALFDDTRHELLLRRIQALNLQPLPTPAYSSGRRWLGDAPGFY